MVNDKAQRHELLQEELVAELKSLRSAIRETAEGFILSKEGEVETLLDYLLKIPPGSLKEIARPWMREARDLKLKPAKGRIKDLKKIDSLLHGLLNYIIESEAAVPEPKNTRKSARNAKKSAKVPVETQTT